VGFSLNHGVGTRHVRRWCCWLCANVRLVTPTLAVSRNLVAIRLTRASLANTSTGPPRRQTSKVALHASIEMI
jgi:hypothetical protein